MRAFEDYCWRDILTPDMTLVYSAYERERSVNAGSAVLVIHPDGNLDITAQPGWAKAAQKLVDAARAQGLPIVHSVVPGSDLSVIEPAPNEAICQRASDSAFLLSNLEAILTRARAKGVIICGAPMSGAVRATAVEAKSFGHKTAIAEETIGDEASLLLKVALFDVAHKYADVMSLDEMLPLVRASSK
ncbi:MAG: isochorismatase family protein [Pseudolabrys sp.]|nr:isochorismatase family protein [Pseudolabrys sp.]